MNAATENAPTARTYSTTVPAVSWVSRPGGIRVERSGKGDHLFICRGDGQAMAYIVVSGRGVAGRYYECDGDHYVVYQEADETIGIKARWEVYASREEAFGEAALWWIS